MKTPRTETLVWLTSAPSPCPTLTHCRQNQVPRCKAAIKFSRVCYPNSNINRQVKSPWPTRLATQVWNPKIAITCPQPQLTWKGCRCKVSALSAPYSNTKMLGLPRMFRTHRIRLKVWERWGSIIIMEYPGRMWLQPCPSLPRASRSWSKACSSPQRKLEIGFRFLMIRSRLFYRRLRVKIMVHTSRCCNTKLTRQWGVLRIPTKPTLARKIYNLKTSYNQLSQSRS